MCENLGVSALAGKRVKEDDDSAIKEHHLFCNHSSGFDEFFILASNNNDFKITLMDSLLINRDHPPLSKNRHSLPLKLFDDSEKYCQLWRRGVVVITTAQLRSMKPELRFCAGSK